MARPEKPAYAMTMPPTAVGIPPTTASHPNHLENRGADRRAYANNSVRMNRSGGVYANPGNPLVKSSGRPR